MKRILLVDAGDAKLAQLAEQLHSTSARVMVANGGLYALTMLERERPDLILTRAHVGDMSGSELCGLVRRDQQLAGIQMVLLAKTLGEKVSAELAAQFDLVLLDDRPVPALAASLRRWLKPDSPEPIELPPLTEEATSPQGPSKEQAIAGTLGVLSFPELTQALSQTGKTGRLILDAAEQPAMVLFTGGRVSHATYRQSTGTPAFARLFFQTERGGDTTFRFEPMTAKQMAEQPQTLDRTAQELLLNAAVEFDHLRTSEMPTLSGQEAKSHTAERMVHEKSRDRDPS